ncbi:GTPase activating protein Gyp10 [Schizosaccharomyces japonicus yFS275]|uniref:GTPase activating protein Gyp10 n=1 Tax=Schizosaccharomyces japonicus (strain yFS275 / FY16936) TaxID=402676 RepID=B6K862_SCHJY|nr:GTPase activating protein Gyp10 [Schizosaccharomyces japonicus yFS275]EEB09716.1 GTPase activating protein Gyp10 [Schizosaccharomyces japonicus yFS275]
MHRDEIKKAQSEVKFALLNSDRETLSCIGQTGHGFLIKSLRKPAWFQLCGLTLHTPPARETALLQGDSYADKHQVEMDMNRSYFHSKTHPFRLRKQRSRLSKVFDIIFKTHPALCYYQGLHDIAQVLLLTLSFSHALRLLEHLIFFRLRDFLLPSLEPTLHQLELMMHIIKLRDPELSSELVKLGVQNYFALSWLITWFSHDIEDFGAICRLFDFFIATHPLTVVYACAQLVLDNSLELKHMIRNGSGADNVYTFLCKLPQQLDVETLIRHTCSLCRTLPFPKLDLDSCSISKYSCLRTKGESWELANNSDGPMLFRMHCEDLKASKSITKDKYNSLLPLDLRVSGRSMVAAITVIGIGIVASQYVTSQNPS